MTRASFLTIMFKQTVQRVWGASCIARWQRSFHGNRPGFSQAGYEVSQAAIAATGRFSLP